MSAPWWEEWPLLVNNGTTPGFWDNSTCYNPSQNTVLSGLEFGGVPVVLLLDFIVFLVLVIIFSIIRKKFWDYGRLALVADTEGFTESTHRRYGRMTSITNSADDHDHERSFVTYYSWCGIDAIHYLSFQRHMIYLLGIITVTSLGIIMPVNMTGDLLSGNDLLWLHTVFGVLYLILTVLLLRRHTSQMKDMRRETTRNTLFVCSVPKTATDEDVKTHFTEAYPSCRVCAVTLGYDVASLSGDKDTMSAALPQVDAIEFYSSKERELLEEMRKQTEVVPQHPLGIAFVTLQTEAMAKYILKDFNALECGGTSCCCCGREPQPSSNSKALRVNKWRVNLKQEHRKHHSFVFRAMNLHVSVFYLQSPIISQFFPTLLLWSFSALLPTIVYYSTLGEAHWSRSREQLSMMRKLYFFLLFMVLILPSLGLTSLAVFFRWLFDKTFLADGKLRFECVFLPDQGAFFVNYVIAAALVGSGMELLRLPGLLLYTIRMTLARSAAERKYVKQNQAYEFEYGAMYGLLYMVLKHLVDRHNLYFAYLPARLDHQVHLGAVNQALAAPIICLIWLYFFSVLRAGFMRSTSLFTLVVLCVTVFFCVGYTCFGHFKYLSPHNYAVSSPSWCSGLQKSKSQQSYGSTEETPSPEPRLLEEDASEA
uniref:Transmembrane protein 63B n=1 Tax=Stegastes partitus TaxID=144197 RepID=A0A3B4YTB4_9TELE